MGELSVPMAGASRRGSSKSASPGQTERLQGLQFSSVCVDVTDKRILWDVTGHALPGRVLAIMGPSGSGKTTLLNTLAGQKSLASGSITMNGQRLSKKVKRKISYVLQADIFFPNLTLKETLCYSAMLRLPSELGFRAKLQKVKETIQTLNLEDCENTLIGNALVRGLSGGEKKRANIACELLTNPTLLLLDEPTSGLDSTSALALLQLITSLASKENKMVVTSIHQPSSRMFHMFDGLLLLAKGKVAYFGPASEVITHFASLGLHCTIHYNPADYILEVVSDAASRKVLIGEDPQQHLRPVKRPWWDMLGKWREWRTGKQGKELEEEGKELEEEEKKVEEEKIGDSNVEILEYVQSPWLPRKFPPLPDPTVSPPTDKEEEEERATSSFGRKERKWPVPWYWQFMVLTVRTFRQSRHILLSKYNIIQALCLSVLVSLVWFQVPRVEESISDRYGVLFFGPLFWSFNSMIGVLSVFPSERVVINKERATGAYHLSAYYLAKTCSELPLLILLPSVFINIVYWSIGLNGAASFFGSWFVLILACFVAQSLGLLVSAVVMDLQKAMVVSVVMLLSFMLVGGFYIKNLPSWLQWFQYISYITYSFDAMLHLEFTPDQQFSCSTTASAYAVCNVTDVANATIPGTAVLEQLNVTLPLYLNILALVVIGLGLRVLAYLALRFMHRP